MKEIQNWTQIEQAVGHDLGIYVFYSACAMAADTVDALLTILKNAEYLQEDTLDAVYTDLAWGIALDELKTRLGDGTEEIEISQDALEQGMDAMNRWIDLVSTDDAMAYLRYLMDWGEDHFDWTQEHPLSLDAFLTGESS